VLKFAKKDARLREFARDLRQTATDAEQHLWFRLRNRQFENCKFRRQHPVAGYVLDFACEELRLGIELDGSQHMTATAQRYDTARSERLQSHGWTILRFWNNDVFEQMEGVLTVIAEAIERIRQRPSPDAP
jgi:very-short-patch-repair endonuclease